MLGLFNTYVSKEGITVIGQRPMFEDSEAETLGRDIKAKFLEVFGCYPVLDISENWTMTHDFMGDELEDGPVQMRDYHVIIDTEFLHHDCYGLSYVQMIFERILKARIDDPTAKEVNTYSSKKYCFSDTEDWWEALKVPGDVLPEGREIISVHVELG